MTVNAMTMIQLFLFCFCIVFSLFSAFTFLFHHKSKIPFLWSWCTLLNWYFRQKFCNLHHPQMQHHLSFSLSLYHLISRLIKCTVISPYSSWMAKDKHRCCVIFRHTHIQYCICNTNMIFSRVIFIFDVLKTLVPYDRWEKKSRDKQTHHTKAAAKCASCYYHDSVLLIEMVAS